MNYKNWLLSIEGHIATLTLNRGKYNRISPETLFELREIAHFLRDRKDIWVAVIEGADEHFSSGVDVNTISLLVGQDEQGFRDNLRDLQDCLDAFEQIEQATIAKIHGYCLGGGLLLSLCCDFRISAMDAIFGLPEVKRSIAVIMGTQRITRVAGIGVTKEMILLAELFDAQRAFEYGLLHQIVEPEELETAVSTLANKFNHLPPRAVGVAKRIIDQGYEMSLRESQDFEIDAQAEILGSRDFQEAIASFFEKRPPHFTGE
ncbi:MAG: enoyl-CoA hydratase/isomerase family protein [Chloroflexi bacterium]|nr:enoyl-CoA hydratase/isomerase family protein [Chloroflexota bacterium]